MEINQFNFNTFKTSSEEFLETIYAELSSVGLSTESFKCDHLCFRVSTHDEYNYYKNVLKGHASLLTEAIVNGRPISTFVLNRPFKSKHHVIPMLELPAPKNGANYNTGFEHAEFVINESFDHFKEQFPHLNFTLGGNKNLNQELCLKLENGLQVKFHHLSLDRVIEIEEAKITDIIFDLDGTLIKSRENIYEINRIVFSSVLDREVSLHESIANFHPEFSKLFEAFSITCPIKQNKAIKTWGTVSERFNFDLFDSVHDMIKSFLERDLNLHLWTARDEYSARLILKSHGIENVFKTLSFANEIDSKPHPNSLRFNWLKTSNNSVLVIGDSPSDILGAKNINAIRAAAFWDSNSKTRSVIQSGAELFFYDVKEFSHWINKNTREVL